MCSSLVLEWRNTVRAVIGHAPALRDLRAGFLSMYPARVFVSRGARMASKGLHVASEGYSMGLWERTAQRAHNTARTI
jgi:hypothetical protein